MFDLEAADAAAPPNRRNPTHDLVPVSVLGGAMSTKDPGVRLSYGELAIVDALITIAQEQGVDLPSKVNDPDPPSGGAHALMARHDGIFRVVEQEILPKIKGAVRERGDAPTLQRLVELRGAAVRGD